jgi:outer membrane protein assembly factor BamB
MSFRSKSTPAVLTAILCLALWGPTASAQDWPEFRGAGGQGHSPEHNLPLTWSETTHVKWKTPIPGRGWSSPAVQGDRIWLTTAAQNGRSLRALAVDRDSGRIIVDVEIVRLSDARLLNEKNSHASPTPIVDGERVYVHFGAHGTAAIDSAGTILWKTKLDYDNGQHGPGASPVLYGDLLIIPCDGQDVQFIVALDTKTGKTRWRKSRVGYQAYATPLVVKRPEGDQLISPGAFRATSYDPATGKERWSVRYGEGFSNVPRPVYGEGLVYICTGFQEPSLLAVRIDGQKDVTKTHVVWTVKRSVPLTPSPLLVGDEIYFVNDNGIASCLDAKTGQEHWRVRIGGSFSASPVYADGRIYFLSEDGQTTVIAAGKQFQRLAVNQIDGFALASMAVSKQSIFIRTDSHLYRIAE